MYNIFFLSFLTNQLQYRDILFIVKYLVSGLSVLNFSQSQDLKKYNKMQTPVDNVQPQQQNTIPDFIRKLQSMIDGFPEVISFSEDGTEVHIHDHQKFVSELLPMFFRHRKWRSFIRQMNMYNFRKLNRGVRTFIFVNPLFWRGNQDNFSKIKRKINTKQQQLQAQNNLQLELKTLLGLQCQNIGIPNCQQLCYQIPTSSLVTLPSLKGPLPIIPNPISGPIHQPSYSNSLTHFITSLLNNRRNTENLCHQIRQNMEIISKQRKNTQCKNILNTIKDSMQMIEEVSNKLRQKMQMYVDDRQAAYSQEQPDFSDSLGDYIARNSMLNLGATQKKDRKQEPGKQVNQIPQMVSFSSASSINLIIPQPIIGVRMGLDNEMNRSQVLHQNYAPQNNVEQTGNNNIFMPIATTFNNMNINGNGYSLGGMGSNEGRRSNGIGGQNYNNNNSIFGSKSQSSFTCLINFDKDQKYY